MLYRLCLKRRDALLFLVLCGLVCLHLLLDDQPAAGLLDHQDDLQPLPKEVVFLLILCQVDGPAEGHAMASAVTRQLQQTRVLLTSALALTATRLRFIVVADSEELYSKLVALSTDFPPQYRDKLSFEYLPVWYPNDRLYMRNMFRECATERLFVPAMLPKEDAIIYIDTDFVFLRPPEDLWAHFHKFDSVQVAAMAPCLYHYGTSKNSQVPFYGPTGLNAGVMHMNLTRMKSFPDGGWLEANLLVFDKWRDAIVLADQDILNILFHKHPTLLYELGCEWNFRLFQCRDGENACPAAAAEGVALLHGNALTFATDREPKIKAVYDTWDQHELGTSIAALYASLRQNLRDATISAQGCSMLPDIDDVLSLQLLSFLKRKNAL
ncbi:glucoside xylosyltransferase 1 [Hyalella azteca]|uniref:UDP-D-xylose:beta-D-glucoside alpha-1,3-D-xylosyltransferase n=1 Tax=Hyalella azteca TaxID=294128 RepID=A0A979FTV9_HYAAZ|nr:glucoside xylosyltransferase 1 [Hyalella azteca]